MLGEDMTLLEFLRKSNAQGEVVHWLRRAHSAQGDGRSLEEFARGYQTFGDKIIAAEMVRIFNDRYFGQWLLLNRPFRRAAEFLFPDILAVVPERYQMFACALRAAPEHWGCPEQIAEELVLAARRGAYVANALAMIRAQKALVDKYLRGKLSREDETPEPQWAAEGARAGELPRPAFNHKQQLFEREALQRLEKVLELRDEADPAAAEDLVAEIERDGSPLVRLGEPGAGKTFVADYLIRWAQEQGLRVLYALPTGQLACRTRQRHPGLAVDTCAGAFLFHREAMALLSEYDMVVVDEALQLSAEEFGRLHAMYLVLGGGQAAAPAAHGRRLAAAFH